MHGQGEGNNVIKDNFLFSTDAHEYTNETRTIFSANAKLKIKYKLGLNTILRLHSYFFV